MSIDGNKDLRPGMRTDRLIELLASDAAVRNRFGATVLKAAGLSFALAAVVFFAMLHVRPDLDAVLGTPRFLFKFAVTVPLAVVTVGILDRIGRPAAPVGPWPWLLACVAAILAVGVGLELALSPTSEWAARLIGTKARYCLLFIPLIAIGPLTCLIAALRQGMPERPGLSGAVAGLASSAIAAVLYATHCPDDSPLFVATWYTLAMSAVTACGFVMGRRFLR